MTSLSNPSARRALWEQRRARLVALINGLELEHMGQGEKWAVKMRAYYRHRLAELDKVEPPPEDKR